MEENKHYIVIDSIGRIVDGWSDGLYPQRNTTGAILLRENSGYQFRLFPGGEENPQLSEVVYEGLLYLYRYSKTEGVRKATQEELALDTLQLKQAYDDRKAQEELNKPPSNEEFQKEIAQLQGKLTASQENAKILEECLVEMASLVYA